MAKKSKEQKQKEALAALLGLDAPTEVSKAEAHDRSMEAEAALEYYENPRTFKQKDCKSCGRAFATRGAPVSYCSDKCRARAFEERMGVKWRPLRSVEERWGFMGEPLTVPPEALAVVQYAMDRDAEAEAYKMWTEIQASEEARLRGLGPLDDYPASEQSETDPTEEVNVLDLLTELGLD
jgi:hypothetical protein